jgi:hypothetical protein
MCDGGRLVGGLTDWDVIRETVIAAHQPVLDPAMCDQVDVEWSQVGALWAAQATLTAGALVARMDAPAC